MIIETRLNSEIQTIIPSKLIEKYNLEEGDIIQWNENKEGQIIITFQKVR